MVSLSPRTTCHGPEPSESQVDQLSLTLPADATVKFARELPLWGNNSVSIFLFLRRNMVSHPFRHDPLGDSCFIPRRH